ncbi:Tfp pilus assembly protein FimT/FimU [Rheinheimera marina]|uniref:Tfp pilus assembly protein FimT/FimU n=1 Tax=Rheinheimera marina TaxID=1774958 RepID=A0ABV9JRM9_9GAMM
MNNRGFTLIEILIATLLLGFVMLVGSLSFSVFSERWRNDFGSFQQDVNQARKLQLLHQVLMGASNYLVRDTSGSAAYFFHGNNHELVFISHQPIFSSSGPALIRLVVQEGASGLQQLSYQESSLKQNPLLKSAPLPAADKSMVLFEAENIRFNYYGWKDFAAYDQFLGFREGSPVWQTAYQAQVTGMLPEAVNIIWANNEPVIIPLLQDGRTRLRFVQDEKNEA